MIHNMYIFQNSPYYEPDEFEKWFYWGIEPEDKNKIEEWEEMLERREGDVKGNLCSR